MYACKNGEIVVLRGVLIESITRIGIMNISESQWCDVTRPAGTVCRLLLFLAVFPVALCQVSNKHQNTTKKGILYYPLGHFSIIDVPP